MQRLARRFAFPVLAFALVCFAGSGCLKDEAPTQVDPDPEFDLTVPVEAVQAWAAAFERKTLAEYDALLADDFQFYPRSGDAPDFPWMTGDSWDRSVELGIAANMFNPAFVGEVPPITAISATATLQSETTNGSGRPELIFALNGTILTGPQDGFAFDTRLKIELVDVGGKYKVREVTELDTFLNGASARSEAASFGSIKNLYK